MVSNMFDQKFINLGQNQNIWIRLADSGSH